MGVVEYTQCLPPPAKKSYMKLCIVLYMYVNYRSDYSICICMQLTTMRLYVIKLILCGNLNHVE